MKEPSIPLSPEHGVNPTIPLCIYCGKEKNQIALLGKLSNDEKAPMKAIIDYEPCENCQAKIDGKGFIGFIGDCGHCGLVKAEALDEEFVKSLGDNKVFRMEKCFKCVGDVE